MVRPMDGLARLYDRILAVGPEGRLSIARPHDLWTLAGYASPAAPSHTG